MASSPAFTAVPTPTQVAAVTAIKDPVVRNLRITECYARLSRAMTIRTGECANWCTFATWASRQAGATIRGEDFLDHLAAQAITGGVWHRPMEWLWRRVVRRGIFNPDSAAGRMVKAIHSPFDAFERASDAVGQGNKKVFEEIGYHFARYLETCSPDASVDSPEFVTFCDGFHPGLPPHGQDLLRDAFTLYQQQGSKTDPQARAQMILLANMQIGLHEQTRLQPEIQKALEAIPETKNDLRTRVLTAMFPPLTWLEPAATIFDPLVRRYERLTRALVRRVITEVMMVLHVSNVALRLGDHLDATYPDDLRLINEPILRQFIDKYDPHGDSCTNCGAGDWADLQQRMHYIVHLFRAYHFTGDLFTSPFSPDQNRQISGGALPDGDL